MIDLSSVGPRVGERFPDVVLLDQTGRPLDLHAFRAGRVALFIVHRSADW